MFDILEQLESNLRVRRVSVIEFAESDEFCDKPLYPRQRVLLKIIFGEELEGWEVDVLRGLEGGRGGTDFEISPFVLQRIEWLQEHRRSHFAEVGLVGGRRSSKGFMTGIAMAKIMFDTMQLQDPGNYYGIDKDKDIYFNCVAGSEAQAKEFQFADFISTVEGCKAFNNNLVKTLETEFRVQTAADQRIVAQNLTRARGKKVVLRDIARLRGKALAANAGTLRGSASMVTTIDEMAHMLEGESKASADQVYNAAEPALAQFKGDGMMFLNSSPWTKIGKFHERHVEAMAVTDNKKHPLNPHLFTVRFPSWALFDEWWRDPGKRWRGPITVSPDWNPDEKLEDGTPKFRDEDREQIEEMRAKEQADPETFKVEYRGQWAEVADAYLRPEMVDRMFGGRPVGYSDDGRVILAPYQSDYGEGAHNYFRYVAHLDPSSTTAGFGFAMGHVEEVTDHNGKSTPHVILDIVKRWKPEDFPGRVIDWDPIMEELIYLADIFRPTGISFDQYQSHEPIQRLQRALAAKNISCRVSEKVATAESNWNRAETFKTALYQGLVHAPSMGHPSYGDEPDQEWAALELKYLQVLNTASRFPKVDRQTAGPVQTKDIADCMMTVVEHLIGNTIQLRIAEELATTPVVMGAPGGYRIGGFQDGLRQGLVPPEYEAWYKQRQGDQLKTGPGISSVRSRLRGGSRLRGIAPNRRRGR